MEESAFNEQLGRRLRSLREARNLSQESLAEGAKVSIKHLGKIERGQVKASVHCLTKIADALNMPLQDVLDTEHEQSQPALLSELLQMAPLLSLRETQIVYRLLKMLTGR